jgi:YVTN family beta-propeller protein
MRVSGRGAWLLAVVIFGSISTAVSGVVNFEVSHVHPIALTPSKSRLLAVNTPDARLEVFGIKDDGALFREASIPVGTEPVSVIARTNSEAWVVNQLSDSVSIVDLDSGVVVKTLPVGDEPTDVAFAGSKAFVAVSQEDRIMVFDLGNLNSPPATIDIFGEDPRALAVSNDGSKVYAVVQQSGNQTTVIHGPVVHDNDTSARLQVQQDLGLNPLECNAPPHPYPPLPNGIVRNPALIDPPDGLPKVSLIVRWNEAAMWGRSASARFRAWGRPCST